MQRYSIVVSDHGWPESLKLLVPFQPTASSAALVEEIVKRASRHGKTLRAVDCTLRLASIDGPILDLFDALTDVVVDEQLFAVFHSADSDAPSQAGTSGANKSDIAQQSSATGTSIPIRLITPAIAKRMTKDLKLLPKAAFHLPASAKLQQLHDDALRYLSNNPPDWLDSTSVLDLHVHELDIASSCFDSTLEETGLFRCLRDGTLTVYAVPRPASALRPAEPSGRIGKNDFYAAGPQWQPEIPQSDRGIAMFLSSLRVLAYLLKSGAVTDEDRERIVYVFDLLCFFPPAVRAFHLLIQGSILSHPACAAVSQAFYCILEDLGHQKLVKNDRTRLFEGARLVLGLVMEKASQLKSARSAVPVYSANIHIVQLQPSIALQSRTTMPLGGPQGYGSSPARVDIKPGNLKLELVTGSREKVAIFDPPQDVFARAQTLQEVVSPPDLRNLHQLAAMCGKVSLSVVRPSLLSSVAAEHLTFDQQGHLAVYTGKAGCAAPGEDTVIFRPLHGEETPNMGQVEQQLAPFLRLYEADGTNVFDIVGSSQSRPLDEPDEIVMFCVDCSASMSASTDLMGIDPGEDLVQGAQTYEIPPGVYTRVLLEDTKAALTRHEIYDDVLGCVVDCVHGNKTKIASKMLSLVFDLTTTDLEKKRVQPMYGHSQRQANEVKMEQLEFFAAGLKRFEEELIDMILLRTMAMSQQKWVWNVGDRLPGQVQMQPLPHEITLIPDALRCPIKLDLIQDPVITADGQVYSRQTITKWMSIRSSSPLTGLMLESTELRSHLKLAEQADKWLQGEDLVEPEERPLSKRRRTDSNIITFSSSNHRFQRALAPTTSLLDLYKIAFRGMRGRNSNFQLSFNTILVPSAQTISSASITGGSVVRIAIANDVNAIQIETSQSSLVKVYREYSRPDFCFWVRENTESTFASILTKYWRYRWTQNPSIEYTRNQVWTGLREHGDGCLTGEIMSNNTGLVDYLDPYSATGILGPEPLRSLGGVTESLSDDEDEDPETRVLVLKVHVAKIAETEQRSRRLSRLEVSKQMFDAMVNRLIAYSYKTHIGLVTFSSTAKVSQSITHVIENFRRSVQSMHASGDTALWDALKLSQTELLKYAEKYPRAHRRIICLSDGDDTKSTAGPADLCWQLRTNEIAVDSVCIGDDNNRDLTAVSNMLKSYCFYPQDLTTALAICEMEPVLSQTERPARDFSVVSDQRASMLNTFFNMRARASFTVVTQDVYPKRKEHPRLEDTFVQLANRVRPNASNSFSLPTLRASRLLVEMREMAANPHPKYDCYVSEADMFFWKVVIEGPPETPYEHCSFLLYLEMPENFPAFPPKGRFVTPLFHPNINRHGRICHSIFDRDWTTDTTLKNVLDTVYGLMLQAEAGDAVHTTVTLGFHHDEVAFAEEARRYARRHGKKTREEWKYELLDLDQYDDDDENGDDDEDDEVM
ncbi:hypothetical protein E4T43_03593 [Aureobasidium subglaciale]|nr:hypothetical protein E4T43_03593 [Aureobasidium subglaciale]